MALQYAVSATKTPPRELYAESEFEVRLVELVPFLRSFAKALSGSAHFAEDLTQDTLGKAWSARRSFTPGSNLKAWLCVILRNELYSYHRRAWRRAPWDAALGGAIAAPPAEQQWAAELNDTAWAMHGLPDPQRNALVLVGVGGFSHEEVAALWKIPVGTVKSRVGRARKSLRKILSGPRSVPIEVRPANGAAMDEILAHLSQLSQVRPHGRGARPEPPDRST